MSAPEPDPVVLELYNAWLRKVNRHGMLGFDAFEAGYRAAQDAKPMTRPPGWGHG